MWLVDNLSNIMFSEGGWCGFRNIRNTSSNLLFSLLFALSVFLFRGLHAARRGMWLEALLSPLG